MATLRIIHYLFLMVRWLFPFFLMLCLAKGYSQDLRPSISLGIETSRSWGVTPQGLGRAPFSLRLFLPIAGDLYFSAAVGYEEYLDKTWDSFAFTDIITDGNQVLILDQGQSSRFFDQALAIAPGIRYAAPGGPQGLRLLIGLNALAAWYPGQTIVRDAGVSVSETNGQTTRLSESRSVTWGMDGYGVGGEVAIALEATLLTRMIVGVECGPSWIQRTLNTRQTIMVSGQNNFLTGQEPEEFMMEMERGGGLVEIQNFDFRLQVYVGLML